MSLLLKDWILKEGTQAVAKRLKVSPTNVRHWKAGYSLPSSHHLFKIKKLSGGKVNLEKSILSHYSKANAKNRWQTKLSKKR